MASQSTIHRRNRSRRDYAACVLTFVILLVLGFEAYQVHSARELYHQRQRLAKVVDEMRGGIVVCDHHGKIVLVNAGVERMLGYKVDELLGQDPDMIVCEPFRKEHHAKMQRALELSSQRKYQGHPLTAFGNALHKDGREIPVAVTLRQIQDNGGTEFVAFIAPINLAEAEASLQQLRFGKCQPSSLETRKAAGKDKETKP